MARRIVQLLSHSIEAHDMLQLYHSFGHEAFDIGGYIDPAHPHDPKRPALPEVPFYPELQGSVFFFFFVDELGHPMTTPRARQERILDAIPERA